MSDTPLIVPHDTPPLQQALAALQQRMAAACQRSGRDPASVRLLAVSKTVAAPVIAQAWMAGQIDFGENYVQEALEKQSLWPHIRPHDGDSARPDPVWHLIGPLQSNKTAVVARQFAWVHSVDRLKIAQRLSDQRPEGLPPLNVCVQVNVQGEIGKSGVPLAEAQALCAAIALLPRLRLRGLMVIPDPDRGASATRAAFEALAALRDRLVASGLQGLDTLSMGMSGDLEDAIAAGSTCVRVGTALFGARTAPPAG
ncbi:YggS family pyridoxal phosphate-dependent enzyme [Amphibiibacter pelophylacis]|uniref:YggS family pyridoxal phosphate-dependent enzyme n=1 Tax=Amphibiibacter pelophylacis TaxID=1799477 RepID=A0ACC6P4D4_9BURK